MPDRKFGSRYIKKTMLPPLHHMPKEVQRLAEPVLGLILAQDHVVGGGGGHKDDGRHIVEALDPLPPLVPLTAHVEHVELDPVHAELVSVKRTAALQNKAF